MWKICEDRKSDEDPQFLRDNMGICLEDWKGIKAESRAKQGKKGEVREMSIK